MSGFERIIENVNCTLRSELLHECGIHMKKPYEAYCAKLTLEDIFTTDSVYLTAKRCALGFSKKNDTWAFQKNAWTSSQKLCEKVLNGSFKPKYYPSRSINERGKVRLIKPPTFECKVVQKVICDYVIRPLLEPKMISSSYASVKGRGTKKMYEDIEVALNRYMKCNYKDKPDSYVVIQSDFSNYFGNIDTNILIEDILGRYIKDRRILDLIHAFSPDEKGLSLGNEASQIPASFFPSAFDHWCKDKMGLSYFRYMDDSLAIVEKSKEAEYRRAIFEYASKLKITLKEEKIKTFPLGTPFVFCKERFLIDKKSGLYYRLMNPAIERNERRKLKRFKEKKAEGMMTDEEIEMQYKGVLGMIKSHPNTYYERKRLGALNESI